MSLHRELRLPRSQLLDLVVDQVETDPEQLALLAFIAAAGTGEADAEFRALWLLRAQRLREAGKPEAALIAEQWAATGRPPAQKRGVA